MQYNNYLEAVKKHFFSQKLEGTYKSNTKKTKYIIFMISGLTCLSLGVLSTLLYNSLYEITLPYDNSTILEIYLPAGTFYFYLEMKNFYQTNLRYTKSINFSQIEGEMPKTLESANPLAYEGEKAIYPAGLLPNTYPQDTFTFDGLEINTENISWKSESQDVKKTQYTRDMVVPPPLWEPYEEIPDLSKDERFVNWIYTASFPSFRKLWGRINVEQPNTYNLNINSTFPYGSKFVTFSEGSFIGTKNYFLSTGLILVGSMLIISSVLVYLE